MARKLIPVDTSHPSPYVTPDFGIVINDKYGIIGEVKKNFSKDEQRASQHFIQVKGYDTELTGWPTENGQIENHEVGLLVGLPTSSFASRFFQQKTQEVSEQFTRSYFIVEFGRHEESQTFFFLRTVLGLPTEIRNSNGLTDGILIPMKAFAGEYSITKLYDAEPPLISLVLLIWKHIVIQEAATYLSSKILKKTAKSTFI